MSAEFLVQMAAGSRARLAAARERCDLPHLRAQALSLGAAPSLRLSAEGFDLIAELKLRSPAVGALAAEGGEQIASRVVRYAQAGAAAVSVLTEPSRFDGALGHLSDATRALGSVIPAMRKDFLVDPYQVYEARVAGAGGVLLILRMLPAPTLRALLEACAELGVFALLEAFDEADLLLAAELLSLRRWPMPVLVGINCRDLATLQVVPGRLEALAPHLPRGVPAVAESGLESGADAARLAQAGYSLALVGSALMRSPDPAALVGELLAAGRAASMPRRRALG